MVSHNNLCWHYTGPYIRVYVRINKRNTIIICTTTVSFVRFIVCLGYSFGIGFALVLGIGIVLGDCCVLQLGFLSVLRCGSMLVLRFGFEYLFVLLLVIWFAL